MQLFAGTSGFSCPHSKGPFDPAEPPDDDRWDRQVYVFFHDGEAGAAALMAMRMQKRLRAEPTSAHPTTEATLKWL